MLLPLFLLGFCHFVVCGSFLGDAAPIHFEQTCMDLNDAACWPFLIGDEFSSNVPGASEYAPNLYCVKVISAPEGQRVVVEFENGFDIEERDGLDHHFRGCDFDYLLFQDGPYQFSKNLTSQICGKMDHYPPIVSSSRHMRIIFQTDDQNNKRGFKMRFRFEDIPGYDLARNKECYFYTPINKQKEITISQSDLFIRPGTELTVDCVWDIHNNSTMESVWLWIHSVFNEMPLDWTDRYLEIIPTDEYLWSYKDHHTIHRYPYILNDSQVFVSSNRFMLHLYSKNITDVPSFVVNISTAAMECGEDNEKIFNCLDLVECITTDLVCNGVYNCPLGLDESEEFCGSSPREEDNTMMYTLVGVAVSFSLLLVFAVIYTFKVLQNKARQATLEAFLRATMAHQGHIAMGNGYINVPVNHA